MFLVPDDYDVLTLNASGTFIWHALMAGTPHADLVNQFAARYQLSHEHAARDVNQLVAQLLANRVLLENPAATDA
jgi:phosphoserine aminotransferase